MHQVLLNAKKIDEFIGSTVRRSTDDFRELPVTVLEKQQFGPFDKAEFRPNNFLAPILWSYNNGCQTPVLIGDHPRLLHVNYLAKALPLQVLKDVIGRTVVAYQRRQQFINAVQDASEELNKRRLEYMVAALKEASAYEKTVAIVGKLNRSENDAATHRSAASPNGPETNNRLNVQRMRSLQSGHQFQRIP